MNYRFYLAATALGLLAGCSSSGNDCAFVSCGGVGAGGGGGTAAIDQNNALAALREGWFAGTSAADIPFLVVATNIGDTSGGVVGLPFAGGVSKIAPRNTVFVDPFGPTEYNCPTSGTFIVEGDVADPMTVTPGDFAIYTSTACDSGTGYTVDGNHELDIASIVGDPNSGSYEQGQTLTFDTFVAASQSLTTTLSGDHSAVIDTQPADRFTSSFFGTSLSINAGNVSVSTRNFQGFMSAQTVSPFNLTLDTAGNASSSLVQGTFNYLTEETFVQPTGQTPSDGIFDVFGTAGSTARVAIVDQTLVRVQVDANGSGNYEISVDMSWPEFLNGSVTLSNAEATGH